MSKQLDEAKEILNDLEKDLEKSAAIWQQIHIDNPWFPYASNQEWQRKKAYCWIHGATEFHETNELERWLFDHPPLSDSAKENAAKCVDYWRKWLEIKDAYYEPFEDFEFEYPQDHETLNQFLFRMAKKVEKEGRGARLEWRALKSFLSYLRNIAQEEIAFIEQIFPQKMGFSGNQIIRKIAPEVYPIPYETAARILIELARQCRVNRTNAQLAAAESLGLCWLCLSASRLRLPIYLESIYAIGSTAIQLDETLPILKVPTLFGDRAVRISTRVAKYLYLLSNIPSKKPRKIILQTPMRSLTRTLDRALDGLETEFYGNITYITFLSSPHHFGNHRYQPKQLIVK